MLRRMKIAASVVIVSTVLLSAPASAAGSCGIGKILEIKEGAYNKDDLVIKIDNSVESEALNHIDTFFKDGWIRYIAAEMNIERLRAIRAVAYMALVSDKYVTTWSHRGGCRNSTELGIIASPANVLP